MKPKPVFATRKNSLVLAGTMTLWCCLTATRAADRAKANNADNLNLPSSWNTLPGGGDVANWTSTVTGPNTVALGANLRWQGIRIVSPGGLVTISPGNTLTLGNQGLNMSAATADLTIRSGLALQSYSGQIWSIAAGRSVNLDTGAFTRGAFATLNIQAAGAGLYPTMIAADSTGLIGPWATHGTGTGARYATVGPGNIIAYTGGAAAATAAAVTDTTGLVNYDVAAIGAFGAGASFNTLRYTGAAGSIDNDFSANGILTTGTGALTLSGNTTIGNSRELVLANGDNSAASTLTLTGIISDNAGGASSLTKAGDGIVVLSGANAYTGATTVTRGELQLAGNGGLGSPDAGTRLTDGAATGNGTGGIVRILDGVSSPEPLYLDTVNTNVLMAGTGTNTLSGPVRINASVRVGGGTMTTYSGGISTTGGANGTFLVANANMTLTGKPLINGGGSFYADQGQARIIGVAGNLWGNTTLGNGTIRTDVANALPSGTVINIGGVNTAPVLDLNGNSQTISTVHSATTFVSANSASSTVTSAAAAMLTVTDANARALDARFTGAVSFTKLGTGALTLTAPSTTTGKFTANAGTLILNPQRADAAASGANTVGNHLPGTAPLTLGGGAFQLSGRSNGSSTAAITGTWTSGQSVITSVSSTAGLAPGQSVSGAGIPAGAYIVSVLTGLPNITGNQFVISANTTAAGTGATITPTTTNSWSTSQTFAGLTLDAGGSGVAVNVNGGAETVLNLGTVTPNPGGTVNFTLPTGTQSATNGITTSNTNTHGILGGWARVGNDWAANSANVAGGNVAALTAYTDVNGLGGVVVSAASGNVRLVTGGASGNVTPAVTGITDIHTLLQNSTAAATYDPGTGDILRLGAAGGILIASTAEALNIGAGANDGMLTAGGADNTAGTIYVAHNNTTRNLSLNSIIADNGTGVVGITTSGPGRTILYGTNTFTGKTVVGGGTLEASDENGLGTTPAGFVADQLTLAGGVFQAAGSLSISPNRGITLAAAGGGIAAGSGSTLTVNSVITGPGDLTAHGDGALALNAANTHTGQTFTNAGTLVLGHVNALQNSTLVRNAGSLTFTVAGTNTYNIGGLSGGNNPIALGANSISVGANNTTNSYGGVISGTGGFTKVGGGTQQFTNANTYSGDTLVSDGMLVLAHANALQNSTLDTGGPGGQSVNLTMPEGTTCNLGGLKGSADLDMAVCNLSIGANGQDTTFSGSLKGAFDNSLFKAGTGRLTLGGINTYSGATTVNGGTLELAGSNTHANDITVNAGGTFALAGSGTLKFIVTDDGNNRITGTGSATLDGVFTLATNAVAATNGSWTLVDATGKSFGPSFAVAGFTPKVDGVTWTKAEGATRVWTFSETSGALTLSTGFNAWIAGYDFSAFPGADLTATGDPDHDGIPNGIEFVIADPPNQAKVGNLPVGGLVTTDLGDGAINYLKLSYRRTTASMDAGVATTVQYVTDLVGPWTTAVDNVAGVKIIETPNAGLPGTDVEVYIPHGANARLFGRLSVTVP